MSKEKYFKCINNMNQHIKDPDVDMQLKQEIEENKDGKIVVNQTVFPGVCMFISNRVFPVKSALTHCQFKVKDSEVVSSPI